MAKVIMPPCIAEYEHQHEMCDGDPNGKDDSSRISCTWRDRCVALKLHCEDTGKRIEDSGLVGWQSEGDGPSEKQWATPAINVVEFDKLCVDLVKKYNVKNGEVEVKQSAKEDKRKSLRPNKRTQEAAAKALAARKMERRAQLRELFGHFKNLIAEQFSDRKFASAKEAATPGRLHVVDRIESSGYISIYAKTSRGRDVPLCLIKFKPRDLTLDLQLTVAPDEYKGIGKVTLSKLDPKPVKDGMFKSIVMGLDKEGCALAAETIGSLVNQGSIELPAA